MEVGVVKIAEDSDFNMLKKLVDDHSNWKLEYDKGEDVKACILHVFILYSFLFLFNEWIHMAVCKQESVMRMSPAENANGRFFNR